MPRPLTTALPAISVLALLALAVPGKSDLPAIAFNDNRESGGRWSGGELVLELEVARVRWHLLGDDKAPAEVLAFAERGQAPVVPGPMIRVPMGTPVRVHITNPLAETLVVHGLTARTGPAMDSLVLPPGGRGEARFTADAEGTYYYWATTTGVAFDDRGYEDAQLHGALIVDPPGVRGPARDRIFVISAYVDTRDSLGQPVLEREFLTINGRPWPHTERLEYAMGDSVHWRLINASWAPHPMHLHGFYYRVDARGDLARDSLYWPNQQRMVVTELMEPGSTLRMSWSPDRPGGWIFHCHLNFHVLPNPRTGAERLSVQEREHEILMGHPGHDPDNHVLRGMGGLMLAMDVRPSPDWRPDERARRVMRLFVQSDSGLGAPGARFGYVLQEGELEPAPDSVQIPGSPLVLQRDEPTTIWVINRTPEPTQVHWHGVELESPFDGVTGLGGYANRRTPPIMPGDSFEVRVTPPRSGSFMYHTHMNDIRQQSHGLYGAFLVVDDRATWTADTDLVFLVGNNAGFAPILNGSTEPPPLTLKAGTVHRLRLMNITLGNPGLRVRLVNQAGIVVNWRPMAKDGYDLPAAGRRPVPSLLELSIGETYDFDVRLRPGEYSLEVMNNRYMPFVKQAITVVE
jgi:manganese oxidase